MMTMTEVRLPFGKGADGRMVAIDAVMRGLACKCVCPKCGAALVAAQGDIYRHHFRHHVELNTCTGARESAIHLFAKQIICDSLQLALPTDLGAMRSARQEVWLDRVKPDVLANYDSEQVAIEIWVAHKVPLDKIKTYATRKIAAVEIDLRNYRFVEQDEDAWRDLVLATAAREWLVPPARVREENERRRQQIIAELREQERAALAAQKEAERLRLIEQRKFEETADSAAARNQISLVRAAQAREQRELERIAAVRQRQELEAEWTRIAEVREALERHREREHAAPDLQKLVRAHGGFGVITPEAWKQWDTDCAAWTRRIRRGVAYQEDHAMQSEIGAKPGTSTFTDRRSRWA
jgi:hypothetical protein